MKIRKRSVAVKILSELAHKYYHDRCFVTHEKFKVTGFTLHHLWYIEGDAKRSNFPDGAKGRDEYYMKLKPLVEENPDRFILITNGVHTRIDHPRRGLSRMKKDNLKRLILAVLLTRK